MTYLAPCFNCAVDKPSCPRRANMFKVIKGLGITSAKFKCPDRQSKFRTGQRVAFDWRYWDDDEDGHYPRENYTATFYGTIMREMPGNRRFSIRVDQAHEDYDIAPEHVLKSYEFTSARPADIRPLDEPDRLMCVNCMAYQDAEDCQRLCIAKDYCSHPLTECWKP